MSSSSETEGRRITREDLEAGFRNVAGEVEETATQVKQTGLAVGAAVLVLLLILAFLAGKRRGTRTSTVVEIRRI